MGDTVISKVDVTHSNETVAIGDRGIVVGQSHVPAQLLCQFGEHSCVSLQPEDVDAEVGASWAEYRTQQHIAGLSAVQMAIPNLRMSLS